MPDHDDREFEARLKEFRPLAAEPLPMAVNLRARRGRLVLVMCAAAALVMLVAAIIARQRANQFPAIHHKVKVVDVVEVRPPARGRPLTIRSANELLARAPSVKSALDGLAFQRHARQLPSGMQSALAVLGEEDLKP